VNKKENSVSAEMTKRQMLALVKCKDCLQLLKDEFLYEHPDRADIFKNISRLSDDDFMLIQGHASVVLKESAPLVMCYGGYYEHLDPFMTINGVRGVYLAWNSGFTGFFFTRKRDALVYVGKCYSEYMNYGREHPDN